MAILLIVLAAAIAASPVPIASAWASPDASVPFLSWEVVSRRPHDASAFTQGLQLDAAGRLFESTGEYGASSVREVDPVSGQVVRLQPLPDRWFGEGLALVDDELVQLTWKAGVALRRDVDTFELLTTHRYEGEGWGLCYDGSRLVMSDGSDELLFRDPESFEPAGSVSVTYLGERLRRLNELECVDGAVWANVWKTDLIVRIDPGNGRVTGVLDLAGIVHPHPREADSSAVLNGIAWDAEASTFLVTGKDWPELIEIRVIEPGAGS